MPQLAHVCIETRDLEKTEAFYKAVGLTRRFEFRNRQGELVGFYLAFTNNTYIEVIKSFRKRNEGAIRHFAVEVEDVDAVRARLVESGVDVSEKAFCDDQIWMVTCTDPNGIFIEFQQYTPESLQLVGGVCEVDYQP